MRFQEVEGWRGVDQLSRLLQSQAVLVHGVWPAEWRPQVVQASSHKPREEVIALERTRARGL